MKAIRSSPSAEADENQKEVAAEESDPEENVPDIMDMGDLANEVATRVIFKGKLDALMPPKVEI